MLGWFLFRLTVASAIVSFAIWYARIPLEHLIARGARNLLALASSPYYLKTIEFVDGGYGFTSWIGPLRGGFKLPSLLFTFGFPIAYAFALPGLFTRRYWLRAIAVVLISYFVCAIAVAIVSDARLTATFLQFGITLQPEWRHDISRFVQYYLWMFTVRLYPLLMVIILALVSDQFRNKPRDVPSRALRVLNWTLATALASLLIVTIGFDSTINARIERVENESVRVRLASIEEANPELGLGLFELGQFLEKQRNWKRSFEAYRFAVDRLRGKPRKLARKARDRVHEQIMLELLEDVEPRTTRTDDNS